MTWIENIFPFITLIAVFAILFLPSSNSKKIKELESRIEELEKRK